MRDGVRWVKEGVVERGGSVQCSVAIVMDHDNYFLVCSLGKTSSPSLRVCRS